MIEDKILNPFVLDGEEETKPEGEEEAKPEGEESSE